MGRATSAAEASLETGHEGVVAGELDWVAGPAAGPGSVSGSADGGDEQAAGRGFERAADRFVEEREAGGPVAERVGAREQPAIDDARLGVGRPVPARTEQAEYLVEVGGLEGAARLNSFGPPGTPEWSRSITIGPWRSSPASHTPPTPACRSTVRRCPRLRRPTRVARTSE